MRYSIEDTILTDIADSIRTGKGNEDKLYPTAFKDEIGFFIDSLRKTASNQYFGFEIIVPPGTPNIRPYAFYKHNGIGSIIIPNSVTDIGYAVFSGCSGLKSVKVGSGLKSMNGEVFNGCSNCLTYDFSKCTKIPTMSMPCFGGINDNAKILVPSHLYCDWVADPNWSSYSKHIVDYNSVNLDYNATDLGTITDITGEMRCPLYYLGIDTDTHYLYDFDSPQEIKAYYSYDCGITISGEITGTDSINGGDLTFNAYLDESGYWYWYFNGSYIYFWGNTLDIWVEVDGKTVYKRHIASTVE